MNIWKLYLLIIVCTPTLVLGQKSFFQNFFIELGGTKYSSLKNDFGFNQIGALYISTFGKLVYHQNNNYEFALEGEYGLINHGVARYTQLRFR